MNALPDPLHTRPLEWRAILTRWAATLILGFATAASAAPTRDRLTLLVPDGADPTSWQIKVWTDSAAEEGIRLDVIADSAFLALGANAASQIAGLVVPDSAHIRASDAVIAAVTQYAYSGGKLMLVYDAGVQTETGFFPTATNSRFANLVGVDYVFWNNGAGASTMVGFGQVVGTKATLDGLSLPPGKYVPYVAPSSLTANTPTAAFVNTSQTDPSGAQAMAATMQQRANNLSLGMRSNLPLSVADAFGASGAVPAAISFALPVARASKTLPALSTNTATSGDFRSATLLPGSRTYSELPTTTGPSADSTPYTISGYLYGPLGYYSYVTSGTFPGTVWLSSPEHGLVAGQRAYGSGQVLFVNLPLGYFKAIGTDAAPLQGFLGLFARDQVGIATLSVQPKGKGGLIYNWHIDDGDDLKSDIKDLLNHTDIFTRGPFSIHFTAGPDVNYVGDNLGMNLAGESSARNLGIKLGNLTIKSYVPNLSTTPRNVLGAHGGWIHNYWADNVNETNAATFTQYLQLNYDAIPVVSGYPVREYAAPGGNTPLWSIQWLESHGIVGTYLVGDVGSGMVRSWRNGARVSSKLWSAPVMPFGLYATWEEFDEHGIADAQSGQWLLDLQSFAVNHRTTRLFYNHPPGARAHKDPINAFLTRADALQLQNAFDWYTISGMADFSQRRIETTWNTTMSSNRVVFTASNANGLVDLTWLLPKAVYTNPAVNSGSASVTSDTKYWIVTAKSGTSLTFSTQQTQ